MTIELKGYIIIPETELSLVLPALQDHIHLTLNEQGCIEFTIEQDHQQLNKFHVYEKFIDQDSFDQHQKLIKDRAWGKLSTNVERHYQFL